MGEGWKIDPVSQRRTIVTAFTNLDGGFQDQARESHLKSFLLSPPSPSMCLLHLPCQAHTTAALENTAFGLHWEARELESLG